MASLFRTQHTGAGHLLDAGAGIGSLTAAFVDAWLERDLHHVSLSVTAYETDALLAIGLQRIRHSCSA